MNRALAAGFVVLAGGGAVAAGAGVLAVVSAGATPAGGLGLALVVVGLLVVVVAAVIAGLLVPVERPLPAPVAAEVLPYRPVAPGPGWGPVGPLAGPPVLVVVAVGEEGLDLVLGRRRRAVEAVAELVDPGEL